MSLSSQTEKNKLKRFQIEIGMPLGPDDLLVFRRLIISLILPGIVGVRKKEITLRNLEKNTIEREY